MSPERKERVMAAQHVNGWEMIDTDADVLHHTLADPVKEVKENERARYEKLCTELGLK